MLVLLLMCCVGNSCPAPGANPVDLSSVHRLRAGPAQHPLHGDGHEGGGHRRQARGAEDAPGGAVHHGRQVSAKHRPAPQALTRV